MADDLDELREWQRERGPAEQRKAAEALGRRRINQRHCEARARLALALEDGHLSAQDISAVLEGEGKLDLVFETKEL